MLSLVGMLPLYVPGITLALFLFLQRDFYFFIGDKIRMVEWLQVFFLHQLYFISALSGWLLARIHILKASDDF